MFEDSAVQPSLEQIDKYIENPLFAQLAEVLENEYHALSKIEYSKEAGTRGWNVKYRKAGKGLCVVYPREGWFTVLVVIGQKEKETVLRFYPVNVLTPEFREISICCTYS